MNKRGIEMEIKQWEVKEDFIFPKFVGMPSGSETVNVTPMFTVNRTDEAVRLNGIYHIAANIELNDEHAREATIENAILIDDVEIEEKMGYFEYAVPFTIDLPAEASDPLNVVSENVMCKIDGQGSFAIIWDIECSYQQTAIKEESKSGKVVEAVIEEKVVVVDKTVEVQSAEEVNEVIIAVAVLDSTSFNDDDEVLSFLAGLKDGVSSEIFRSKDVTV